MRRAVSTPQAPSEAPKRRVDLGTGTASVVDEGEGAPEFLLVHGLPGSARDFRWLTPCLGPSRRVRLEMPGFGGTPRSTGPDPSVEARARFVIDACDALELRRPILVGHSMGGIVGARAASLAPDRFAGLALISSPGLRAHRAFSRFPRRRLSWALRLPGATRLMRPMMRAGFRAAGFVHGTDEERVLTVHCIAATSIPEHAACLRTLTLPLLHAFCDDDPLVEAQIMAQTAEVTGGPVHRFADGGHNPQKHHAVELGDALQAWARSLS